MIQQFLQWLGEIGMSGLLLTMMIEGSSVPFPGIFIAFSYGYVMSLGLLETIAVSAGMSVAYSLTSIIPYSLGHKVQQMANARLKKGMQKAQMCFRRYGLWSIALSRPFGIGNYISYAAGISKVRFWKYIGLTFLGIYPWSLAVLFLGRYFNGNVEAVGRFFRTYDGYFYLAGAAAFLLGIVIYMSLKRRFTGKKGRADGNGEKGTMKKVR